MNNFDTAAIETAFSMILKAIGEDCNLCWNTCEFRRSNSNYI